MGYILFGLVNENGEEVSYAVELANAITERTGIPQRRDWVGVVVGKFYCA